jgi:hypothetical protein
MTASAKTPDRRPDAQDKEPAKGGTERTHRDPSGDSLKHQGDKLQHAVDEAAERKKANSP